jgi:hypothetical protein
MASTVYLLVAPMTTSNHLIGIALLVTLLNSLSPFVNGFVLDYPPRPYPILPVSRVGSTSSITRRPRVTRRPVVFYAKEGFDDESDVPTVSTDSSRRVDNFDANGFVGYLVPYALAVVAAIVVTGAFVKFVLLDY